MLLLPKQKKETLGLGQGADPVAKMIFSAVLCTAFSAVLGPGREEATELGYGANEDDRSRPSFLKAAAMHKGS